MERTMKVRKNFYELTEEDLQGMLERDVQAVKEGRCVTLEEACQHWKERYGIEFEN